MQYERHYNPNRSADWNHGGSKWRLSRSKIDLFVECPRCFYLDNKLGTARPRGPAFTLNVAVDELFKKEFDAYRKKKQPHPIMKEYDVDAIPFVHKSLNEWRDNFSGITYSDPETKFTISGAIDDIWITPNGALIVVDYKATSKGEAIHSLEDVSWGRQYKRQMEVYQWLFEKNGFTVDSIGYFVYANATTEKPSFDNLLHFETTLVPCEGDHRWISGTLTEIKKCLESDSIPPIGDACEYCPYREASGKKLQMLHRKNQ